MWLKREIGDPYRINSTLGTLYNIVESGGKPVVMSHVGLTRDKNTGHIKADENTSVDPVAEYLEQKLHTESVVPHLQVDPLWGIQEIDTSINLHIRDLMTPKPDRSMRFIKKWIILF